MTYTYASILYTRSLKNFEVAPSALTLRHLYLHSLNELITSVDSDFEMIYFLLDASLLLGKLLKKNHGYN